MKIVDNNGGGSGAGGKDDNDSGRVSSEWWAEHVKEDDRWACELSGKLLLLAEILRACEAIGDKV